MEWQKLTSVRFDHGRRAVPDNDQAYPRSRQRFQVRSPCDRIHVVLTQRAPIDVTIGWFSSQVDKITFEDGDDLPEMANEDDNSLLVSEQLPERHPNPVLCDHCI